MHILLVEDDETLANGVQTALTGDSYNVTHVASGDAADQALQQKVYDLILLDLTLPKMDGSEVLRRLRERGSHTPVIVLTARGGLQDRIIGLDLGADDYLAKPFALAELEARIRARLRRSQPLTEKTIGGVVLDRLRHTACCGGIELELSARELELLEVLLNNLNKIVSREQILAHFVCGEEVVGDNALEVYVHRLRKRFIFPGFDLKTIRGVGYMLTQLS
jgi:two-component system, OmpR family, response regulator